MTDKCICINDIQKLAERNLTRNALHYYNSGATDEQTLEENCIAFKSWRFQPRVLRDVSKIDTSSSILGNKIAFPVCISPTALNKLASVEGEIASAKAAHKLGTGFTLSTWATTSIEEIANNVPNVLRWFQLHWFKNKNIIVNLVQRAARNGYRALMVTVDLPVGGKRYKIQREKLHLPSNLSLKNLEGLQKNITGGVEHGPGISGNIRSMFDPTSTWKHIDWLKTITDLPIIVKGILTAEMAMEALEHEVAGIFVSNHGARQLDGVLSTIEALPPIVRAVNGRCEIYLDGGVRNGGDVAKAIAIGANAVFVGRPIIWGLACDGEAGARKVLEILRDEFEVTMKLLGVTSISELQSVPNLVVHYSKVLAQL